MGLLKKLFLYTVSFPAISRLWGSVTRIRHPRFLVHTVIRWYANHFRIDMREYMGNYNSYSSLAEFFVRPLDPVMRPLLIDEESFLSPCDGVLTACEYVTEDRTTLVKGKQYSVRELLGVQIDMSRGWWVATIYLSPKNYHRFHMPVDGEVVSSLRTGCRLYPVNGLSVNNINNLFVENERVVITMKADDSVFYYIPVGATCVGCISLVFDPASEKGKELKVDEEFAQMAEIGRFEMGSTIVLVIPGAMVSEQKMRTGSSVMTGEILFSRTPYASA